MFDRVLLAVAAVSPVVAAVTARRLRRPSVDLALSGVGIVAAVVLVARVAGDRLGIDGNVLTTDRVGAAWGLFVLVVAGTVRAFARRQLAADPWRERFHLRSAAVATTAVLLATTTNLWVLTAAAVASSLATAWLVGGRPGSTAAARTVVVRLLTGDALLLAAVVVLAAAGSSGSSIGSLLTRPLSGLWLHVAACLVVGAALVRCAQPPAHQWLPTTLVAPTPASALLHAGIVNAGGVVLLRCAPLVLRSGPAVLVGLVGAATGVVLGVTVMVQRSDVKGALVWSTTAQMGFMLAQLLVGLGSAAALHLVAHGMYKSSAFLTSGSSLEHRPVTPPSARRGHHLLAAALTACAVVIGSLVSGVRPGQHHGAAVMTLAFAAAATFAVLDGPTGVRRGRRDATAAVVTGTMLTLCTYLWVAHHIEYWLRLPEVAPSAALALAAGFTAVVLGSSRLAHLDTEPTRRLVRALRARSLATSRRPLVDALLAGGR